MMVPFQRFIHLHDVEIGHKKKTKGWHRNLHGEKSNLKLVKLQHIEEIHVRERKIEPIGLQEDNTKIKKEARSIELYLYLSCPRAEMET